MTKTEERPVTSDEEFGEVPTVRLSDFNALKEMFLAHKSGDASGQMTSLQCFNSNDMIKPHQDDMEPGTFHNWNELFVSYMLSIDRKWELILTTLQRKDAAVKEEDISCIQDELKICHWSF